MSRLLAILIALAASAGPCLAQASTQFTYQGELHEGAFPATGSYDMVFSLWDAAAAGSQIGASIDSPGVAVEDGKFAVILDFGTGPFDNTDRWLEVNVEGIKLAPRHAVTRTPYSLQTRGIFVDDAERVGIGTTAPQARVHVEDDDPAIRVTATGQDPSSAGRLELQGGRFPSQFAPLGSIDFLDESGALRAVIAGNKSGGSAAQLGFSVVPGEVAQLNIGSSRTRITDRLDIVRATDLDTAAQINGDGSSSFLQSLGGSLAIGHEAPVAPLDVSGNTYFRDRVGIGIPTPVAPLDVTGNAIFRDRVGIGISSPTAALDVFGDSTFRNRLRIGTTTTNLFGQLNIDDSGSGSIFAINAYSNQSAFPTIYADNDANGPVLWAVSGGDVSPTAGGTIVVGDAAGLNLAMDNNEIMARSNGETSTLYLNNDGGEISMGEHRIHPALAYGLVTQSGTLQSGSSNVTSVQRNSTGDYRIFVEGNARAGDIILVTLADGGAVVGARVDGTKYFVYLRGNNTGDPIDLNFQFVIYRP